MKLKIMVLGMLLGALCGLLALAAMTFLPANIHYTVTETYQFQFDEEGEALLAVLLPTDGPYQSIKGQDVQWPGSIEERKGTAIDVLFLHAVLPPGVQEASITYRAVLRQGPVRWTGAVDPVTVQPQPHLESDHPEIQAAAAALGAGTSRDDVRVILEFVADYLELPEGDVLFGRRPTALAALQSGEGVCDDFAHLMAGLLRARDIPARVIWGLVFTRGPGLPFGPAKTAQWNHPGQSHAWVEVFTGERWELAEPTWAKSQAFWRLVGWGMGTHLSYGDALEHHLLYDEVIAEVRAFGPLVGAMSAPLKFAAASTGADVGFVPSAAVSRGWDGRWFNGIVVFFLGLIPSTLLIRRLQKKARK